VRAIAEAHGSKIHIESTTDVGTTVRIVLPLAAGHEQRTRLRLVSSAGSGEMPKGFRAPAANETDVAADD
jgi:hypothetical protein